MIELFRTNIKHNSAKKQVLMAIREQIPGVVATLELDDNDKMLRVVGAWSPVPTQQIIELVQKEGFVCEVFHD